MEIDALLEPASSGLEELPFLALLHWLHLPASEVAVWLVFDNQAEMAEDT